MELSKDIKEVLLQCKDALKNNDLQKVYEELLEACNEEAIEMEEVGEVTEFFEEKGIHIEDYLTVIPICACCTNNYPKRWEKNGVVTIPPQIKAIEESAFGGCKIKTIDISNVQSVKPFAFAPSSIQSIIVGEQTYLNDGAFDNIEDLKIIYVPNEKVGQDILDNIAGLLYIALDDINDINVEVIDINTKEVYNWRYKYKGSL